MDPLPVSDRFELRHAATDHVSLVTVPPRRLFAIDGFGPPRSPGFDLALETLRAAATQLDATLAGRGPRHRERPLAECLWWPGPTVERDELVGSFATRADWRWEQLLEVSPDATREEALAAIDRVRARAGREQPLLRLIELRELDALQILAVGGRPAEAVALERLLDAVTAGGLTSHGDVHQLFLTDPALVPEDHSRTILRVPVLAPQPQAT